MAFQFFCYSVLSYFQDTVILYSACSQLLVSHWTQELVCVEGEKGAGLLVHLARERRQCPKALVAMEHLSGEPPAWVWGAPCVMSCSYKPPSAFAVLLVRGLKLGQLKLWPKTVEPLLLYTRGCSDNVIVSEELIGYHLYWGHLSGRHLALFLVNTWVATDDRRCSSLRNKWVL